MPILSLLCMSRRVKRFGVVILYPAVAGIFLVLFSFGQGHAETKNRDNERFSYRRLTWADFRVDDKSPGKSAQTQAFLSYQYSARAEGVPSTFQARVTSITFAGGFDRTKSWRRSSVSTNNRLLLEHEQGHLDLTELKRRELMQLPLTDLPIGEGSTPRSALTDLDTKMRAFYKWHMKDLEQTQRRYDRETEHGTIRPVQERWNTQVRVALQLALHPPPQENNAPIPLPIPAP
jgi:hypothetical protein